MLRNMNGPEDRARTAFQDGEDVVPELRILIVSESDQLLQAAMQTCNHLMAAFDGNFTYQIAQGSFATLEAPVNFREYLRASRCADLIFCVSEHAVPGTTRRWIVDCIRRHQDGDFVLVDMTVEGLTQSEEIQRTLKSQPERLHPKVIRQNRPIQNNSTTTSSSWHIARPCHGPHYGINE